MTEYTRLSFSEKVMYNVGGKSKPNMNKRIVSPPSALCGRLEMVINSLNLSWPHDLLKTVGHL